jgi:hypothetical protein
LANNCRQSRADKLKLLKAYFSRSVSYGLHRGASKHVYDSTCNAVGQFDEVLDESLIDRQGCAPDGQQCQVSGNEATQFFGFAPNRQISAQTDSLRGMRPSDFLLAAQ